MAKSAQKRPKTPFFAKKRVFFVFAIISRGNQLTEAVFGTF